MNFASLTLLTLLCIAISAHGYAATNLQIDSDLEKMRRQLESKDEGERQAVIDKLATIGPRALPVIAAGLANSDPKTAATCTNLCLKFEREMKVEQIPGFAAYRAGVKAGKIDLVAWRLMMNERGPSALIYAASLLDDKQFSFPPATKQKLMEDLFNPFIASPASLIAWSRTSPAATAASRQFCSFFMKSGALLRPPYFDIISAVEPALVLPVLAALPCWDAASPSLIDNVSKNSGLLALMDSKDTHLLLLRRSLPFYQPNPKSLEAAVKSVHVGEFDADETIHTFVLIRLANAGLRDSALALGNGRGETATVLELSRQFIAGKIPDLYSAWQHAKEQGVKKTSLIIALLSKGDPELRRVAIHLFGDRADADTAFASLRTNFFVADDDPDQIIHLLQERISKEEDLSERFSLQQRLAYTQCLSRASFKAIQLFRAYLQERLAGNAAASHLLEESILLAPDLAPLLFEKALVSSKRTESIQSFWAALPTDITLGIWALDRIEETHTPLPAEAFKKWLNKSNIKSLEPQHPSAEKLTLACLATDCDSKFFLSALPSDSLAKPLQLLSNGKKKEFLDQIKSNEFKGVLICEVLCHLYGFRAINPEMDPRLKLALDGISGVSCPQERDSMEIWFSCNGLAELQRGNLDSAKKCLGSIEADTSAISPWRILLKIMLAHPEMLPNRSSKAADR